MLEASLVYIDTHMDHCELLNICSQQASEKNNKQNPKLVFCSRVTSIF